MGAAEAWVNKIIETKEASVLITDDSNTDKLLRDDVRQKLAVRGLEILHPSEYDAVRATIIKNVGNLISALSEEEIAGSIDKELKVKKVVKIPNSKHLMKIVLQSSCDADKVIEGGYKSNFKSFRTPILRKKCLF